MSRSRLGNSAAKKLSYCRAINDDPAYLYSGSVDFGIYDRKSGNVLTFSVENMGGQWTQLVLYPPVDFKELRAMADPTAEHLSDLFVEKARAADHHIDVSCWEVTPDKLLALLEKHMDGMDSSIQESIMTAIHEIFS